MATKLQNGVTKLQILENTESGTILSNLVFARPFGKLNLKCDIAVWQTSWKMATRLQINKLKFHILNITLLETI